MNCSNNADRQELKHAANVSDSVAGMGCGNNAVKITGLWLPIHENPQQ